MENHFTQGCLAGRCIVKVRLLLLKSVFESFVLGDQLRLLNNCLILPTNYFFRCMLCRYEALNINAAAVMILHPGQPKLLFTKRAIIHDSITIFEKVIGKLFHVHHFLHFTMIHRAAFLVHWLLYAGC